jgi:hypothetical protein
MKNRRKCAEEWTIQAYIDGELSASELILLENHLTQCPSCSKRIAKRKEKVSDVLGAIELIYTMPAMVKKTNQRSYAIAFSIAATALIFIVFFSLMQHNDPKEPLNAELCEWVDAVNFQPELESPNRLYQMRVIAISEVDVDGNEYKYYLVKQCKNHNKSN